MNWYEVDADKVLLSSLCDSLWTSLWTSLLSSLCNEPLYSLGPSLYYSLLPLEEINK